MKKQLIVIAIAFMVTSPTYAAWHSMKKHIVFSGLVGFGNYNGVSHYQATGRSTYYLTNWLGMGGEVSVINVLGQYNNFDAGSIGGFLHAKLPFGFYAEGGLAGSAVISQGRSATPKEKSFFYAAGFNKTLGSRLALEVQYRRAPKSESTYSKYLQNGFFFGLSVKI